MNEKWIIKSRAFLAMLGPLVAWMLSEFGAPEGTPEFVQRTSEWLLAGAGVLMYGLHLFRPDNAQATLTPDWPADEPKPNP